MGSLEPFINVLTVLTVLSVAAERATNVLKLWRHDKWKDEKTREREFQITWRNLIVGVMLAFVIKADLLAMLAHADAPWSTLGWTHWNGTTWVRHEAAASVAGVLQALLGSAMTGLSLGFGSKFWHDVLGIVLEMRTLAQNRAAAAKVASPVPGGE